MPPGFSGNLIFAIIARMLWGNHLNKVVKHRSYNNEISNIKHNFDRTNLGNVGLMFQKRAIHALASLTGYFH